MYSDAHIYEILLLISSNGILTEYYTNLLWSALRYIVSILLGVIFQKGQ